MEVSQDNIRIAKFIANAIGFEPHVFPYYDNNKEISIDILDIVDPLDKNVKFFCTIGLSDYLNMIEMKNGDQNIPVELLMTGYKEYDKIPNILSTCAFYLSKNKWTCQPGSVFKGMVDFYYKKEMQHIMFVRPFLWADKLEPLILENKTVNWLLAVPISESELQYKIKNGFDNLQDLFEKNNVDIFDLDRKSVL